MSIINIDINVVLTYLAAGAGGAGLGAWIFKRWAESWIEKRGKKYQNALDAELMLKQADINSKAQLIQSQLDEKIELVRIEYGTLYTKRLSAIEGLYKWLLYFKKFDYLINRAYDSQTGVFKDISSSLTEKDKECLISFDSKLVEFKEYIESIELYLPSRIAKCVGLFNVYFAFKLNAIAPENLLWREFIKNGGVASAEEKEQISKALQDFRLLYQEMVDEGVTMDKLIDDLQNEFRKLIGADIQRRE